MAEELDPIRQNIEINVSEKGVDETTGDIGKLNTKITESTTASANNTKEVNKSEEAFKSLKVQLKEAIATQQKMSQQYGAVSAEATKAAKAVAGIKDEIGFQKDLVDSYNPDEKFRGLTQTAGLAALALGGVKDGLAAVGIESKALDTLIGSAQAILGVTSAVAGITDAYEVLTAAKKAKTAAEVVEIGTTEALAVAEGEATVATWSFTSALLANPAVAIAAAVIALVAILYTYIKVTSDSEKATALSVMQNEKLEKSLKSLEDQFKRNNTELDFQTNKSIALAKANGGSSSAIRALTLSLAQQETAEKKLNSAKADALVIAAERALRDSEADEDTKKRLKETLDNALKFSEEQSKILQDSYKKQRQIVTDNEVQIAQERTDARNKALENQKKHNDELLAQQKEAAKARLQAHKDELKEFNTQSEEIDSFIAKSKMKQEDEKKKKEAEAEEARKKKLADEIQQSADHAESQKRIDEAVLQNKLDNQQKLVSGGEQLIKNVASLAGKNKAIQKATIIAEGGMSVGKAIANTGEAVTKDLAKGMPISAPLVALDLAVGATSVASIIKGTSQALKAVGGGSAPSGSVGGGATPSRNVAQVGFQSSSENQISTAIAQQQKDQPPVQAFVVSQTVTDQQEIDRKKELNNSF